MLTLDNDSYQLFVQVGKMNIAYSWSQIKEYLGNLHSFKDLACSNIVTEEAVFLEILVNFITSTTAFGKLPFHILVTGKYISH